MFFLETDCLGKSVLNRTGDHAVKGTAFGKWFAEDDWAVVAGNGIAEVGPVLEAGRALQLVSGTPAGVEADFDPVAGISGFVGYGEGSNAYVVRFYRSGDRTGLEADRGDLLEALSHCRAASDLSDGGEGGDLGLASAGVGPFGNIAEFQRFSGGGIGVGASETGGAQVVEFLFVGSDSFAVVVAGEFVVFFQNHLDPVGRIDEAVGLVVLYGLAGVGVVVGEENVILNGRGLGIEEKAAVIDSSEFVGLRVGDAEKLAEGRDEIDVRDEVGGSPADGEEFRIRPDEGDADGFLVAVEGFLAKAAVAEAHFSVVGGSDDQGVAEELFSGGAIFFENVEETAELSIDSFE